MLKPPPTREAITTLRLQISQTQSTLARLKAQLHAAEAALAQTSATALEPEWKQEILGALSGEHSTLPAPLSHPPRALSPNDYKRYGRQLIMPEVGLQGQLRIKKARVLVVGAGGLGCPASAYLAGAGVGTLGLIDGDTVEVSNLHRQIAHATSRVGMSKVDSAIAYCRALNPDVEYIPHRQHLTPTSALDIFAQYDIILDCTDHPTSRYLISDACVLANKLLISASALKTEGQLTVLNNPPAAPGHEGGPCYRCIFPRPPPPEAVTSCGEGGILGPVVGVMGVLQALETLKLIANPPTDIPQPSLLLFSAYSSPQFRNVRLRSRRKDCVACSAEASITPASLTSGSLDYIQFCGVAAPVALLPDSARVTPHALASIQPAPLILDVRDPTHFELCSLPNSLNIPWQGFDAAVREGDVLVRLKHQQVVVVCKLGNDSQMAVKKLWDMGAGLEGVRDLRGGLRAWRDEVDDEWPDY